MHEIYHKEIFVGFYTIINTGSNMLFNPKFKNSQNPIQYTIFFFFILFLTHYLPALKQFNHLHVYYKNFLSPKYGRPSA